jgi:hypothetical protein
MKGVLAVNKDVLSTVIISDSAFQQYLSLIAAISDA